jgi:hypothetical protein
LAAAAQTWVRAPLCQQRIIFREEEFLAHSRNNAKIAIIGQSKCQKRNDRFGAFSPFATANGKLWRIVAIGNRKLRGKPTPTDLFARIAIKNRTGRLPRAGTAGLIHTLASSRYGSRKKALLERGSREPSG